MPWWGWLLLGAGVSLLSVLILWLILRKRGGGEVDRAALADVKFRRLREELEAESEMRRKAERIGRDLELELRGVAERKKKRLEEVDEETRKRFSDLSDDPDALLSRVDEILSGKTGTGPP